jgi:hypothetical protein
MPYAIKTAGPTAWDIKKGRLALGAAALHLKLRERLGKSRASHCGFFIGEFLV